MRTIAKYDWAKIKAEYISSSISLRDLAKKYGISLSALKERSSKEHWTADRKANQTSTATKVVRKMSDRAAARIANELDKEYAIADQLADVLARALADDQQFNRHLVNTKIKTEVMDAQTVTEKQFDKIDMRAVEAAVKSLQGIETVKRRIKGILTEPEKRRDELDREKLELDKKRTDKGEADETEYGVVILPEIDPEPDDPDDDDDGGEADE